MVDGCCGLDCSVLSDAVIELLIGLLQLVGIQVLRLATCVILLNLLEIVQVAIYFERVTNLFGFNSLTGSSVVLVCLCLVPTNVAQVLFIHFVRALQTLHFLLVSSPLFIKNLKNLVQIIN